MTSRPARTVRQRLRNRFLVGACVTLGLVTATLVGNPASASSAPAGAGCSASTVSGPTRIGRIGGIVHPQRTSSNCTSGAVAAPDAGLEAPYNSGANPPLIWHGGPMMSTQATSDQVVVTPIFWEPSGFAFTAAYKNTITAYLNDLAADSGKLTNVFATLFQYSGSNGGINYKMSIGTAIDDTTAFPADGCTLQANDTTLIYADGTGYSKCIDDTQVITETNNEVAANSLPNDLGHLYVMFLPKHVESCFNAGSTTVGPPQACSLNHQPSAAYCAYHSQAPSGTVYANMPFPAYQSGTGFTCAGEGLGGGIQAPNLEPDADVEISPLSHEMAEAITDPDVSTGWYDAGGFENGDDCAYIYGTLSGAAGAHYNQTINGHHYLTQEEFSNADFVPNVSGCLQGIAAVTPIVAALSSSGGPASGGGHLTITGTGFPGATAVHFGAASAAYTVLDASHIDATIPAGTGAVDVTVSTAAGTSAATALDHYTYTPSGPAPTVTGVSPTSGPSAGGQSVTISGTGFNNGATVSIGGQPATAVSVNSPTQITVTTPAHTAGTVDTIVTTANGSSTTTSSDHYTYVAPAPTAPTVTAVSPASGPAAGGQRVTISGTGFSNGATVAFGSSAGKSVTVVSPTTITVTSPKHAKGAVDVRVTTAGGASPVTAADRYTYLARPKVAQLSRRSGTHKGGTKVTITGRHFTAGSTVLFGGTVAKKVTFVSSTELKITSPRHAKGRIHVTVRNLGGHSSTSKADRYTFT